MLRRFRPHLRYADIAASLALFVALGGSAYAAVTLTKNDVRSKHIRNGQVKKRDIARKAVNSARVKDGTLLSRDFKPGQLVAGAPGPAGPAGPKGDPCPPAEPACVGAKGDRGDKGDPGADGEDLTHDSVLPSGETITGVWGVAVATGELGVASFQFRPRLPADVPDANTHYVEGPSAPSCPGQGQAAPGHFCIYQVSDGSISPGSRWNPTDVSRGADATGGIMFFTGSSTTAHGWGVWAVSAP